MKPDTDQCQPCITASGTVHDAPSPSASGQRGVDETPAGNDCLQKVYVEITSDCDLDCQMCIRHSWEDAIATMTPGTFAKLIAQLREVPTVTTVNLSGFGEPTCHPQFFDFLSQVKNAGLRAEVVTNGVSLNCETATKFVDLELDRLVVSLDGIEISNGTPHHGHTGTSVRSNLRRLCEMRALRRTSLPEVWLQFVASRQNVHKLAELKRLARHLGFTTILVSNLVPYQRELAHEALYQKHTMARRNRPPSTWGPVVDLPRLDPHSEASQALESLCGLGTHVRVGGADVVGGGMYCRFVNEGCVAVTPDGRVSPCLPLMHTYSYYFGEDGRRIRACYYGNICETPLKEIWSSSEYRAFRSRVRNFVFSPCIDCRECEMRESNEEDCYGNSFPCCGECLWAAGLVQCP